MNVLAIGLNDIFRNMYFYALAGLHVHTVAVESDPVRCKFWRKNSNILVYESLGKALAANRYDVAVVTTFPHKRVALLRTLYKAGIRVVICETPVETTMRALTDIETLVKQGMSIIPCHTWLYSPVSLVVQEQVEVLTRPFNITIEVQRTPILDLSIFSNPLEASILFNQGYHSLCLACKWAGEQHLKPVAVDGRCDLPGTAFQTNAVFQGETTGTGITLVLSRSALQRIVNYRLTDGIYDITGDDSRILIYRPDKKRPVTGQLDHPISHDAHHLPWYKEIYHLIHSELSGSTEEVSELWEQALQVNRAIISLHQTMS